MWPNLIFSNTFIEVSFSILPSSSSLNSSRVSIFICAYAGLVCGEANACYVRWVVTVYNCINPEYACQSRIVIFSVNQMRGEYTVNGLHTHTHRDTRQSIMTYPTQRVIVELMGWGDFETELILLI